MGLTSSVVNDRVREGSSKELHGHVFRRCPEHLADQEDRADEVWADAKVNEQLIKGVMVSTLGRVQTMNGRRTDGFIRNGRHAVNLQLNKKTISVAVNVLMAHTFIGPPPTPKHTVDHIDGEFLHDILTNLRWATKKEQGRNQKSNRAIQRCDLAGNVLETYGTIAEAVEANGGSHRGVKNAAEVGRVTGGFRWQLV